MRLASVVVSFVALLAACADDSFSAANPDPGSDAAAGDGAVVPSDAGTDGAAHGSVAVRDFSTSEGDLSPDAGDLPIDVKAPGGAQPSDVLIAIVALFPVLGTDSTTLVVPPSGWQPQGSFFNDAHGGNASFYWHAFAFATTVTTVNQNAQFKVTGFPGYGNPTHWYAALVAYSGASLASVDFKGINDTPGEIAYVSFPSVIVGANGSHVFGGLLAEYSMPTPLLGLPSDATELGGGFMSGYGRFTDRPVPVATTLPAYTLPTGAGDAAPNYASTTFQFVIAPAN